VPAGRPSKIESSAAKRFANPPPQTKAVILVDFGSTYSKLTAVEADSGRLLGTAQHPMTVDEDVLVGFEAARDALSRDLNDAIFVDELACSSAGGGLRLAVVGLEPDLTAEAARRAALNAGARVVTVISLGLTSRNLADLIDARPDIVLLAGGTDGGNASVIIESARVLAASSIDVPIVVAGNKDAQPAANRLLREAGKHVVSAPNLMPEIGLIRETEVREAIRAIFIEHVIGGKHLSSRSAFAAMVLMPTPDAVLTATELLAEGSSQEPGLGDLMVIDLGGATTDVHSVVHANQRTGYAHDLIGSSAARRTVEADLGLRWNAVGILDAAVSELGVVDVSRLREAAERRAADPHMVADSTEEMSADLQLASYAIEIASRRHAGRLTIELSAMGAALRLTGRDLRGIPTVVLSGGIFQHADPRDLVKMLSNMRGEDGLLLPRKPRVAVDRSYILAAAGLLATRDRAAAFALMTQEIRYLPHLKEGLHCSASN
jgi:uncharacterized protein (TIGR01319 family)